MDAARADAARIAQEAKAAERPRHRSEGQGGGRKINLKSRRREAKIREALASARSEIEAVAAEATQEMVQRLAGLTVDPREAAAQ